MDVLILLSRKLTKFCHGIIKIQEERINDTGG